MNASFILFRVKAKGINLSCDLYAPNLLVDYDLICKLVMSQSQVHKYLDVIYCANFPSYLHSCTLDAWYRSVAGFFRCCNSM